MTSTASYRTEVYVPLSPQNAAQHVDFQAMLVGIFGGYTALAGHGAWFDSNLEETVKEAIVCYVLLHEAPVPMDIELVARRAKEMFGQQQVLAVTNTVTVGVE